MALLISFTPWFLFWIFAFYKKMALAAALFSFLSMLAIILINRRHGRKVKSLQIGTLVFFFLFALATLICGKKIITQNVDLLGNSAILIIVLITIVWKRPFTMDFICERTEEKFWKDPRFIRMNYVVSWFWFVVLLLNFALVAARHFSFIQIDRPLSISIRIFNCIMAMKFTQWYLRHKQLNHSFR